MKQLYFGDCLDVLRDLSEKHPQGLIDLIYIDPPFNSKRNYNILFEDLDMTDTKAQREAFADTWSNVSYKDTLGEIADLNYDLYEFLKTLDKINISKSSVAYLTTMAIRIHYMHKVLKATGSFYLHCDPEMSHYLKVVCDLIFENFRNEISWKRANPKSHNKNNFVNSRDVIHRFTKSKKYIFNKLFTEHDESYVKKAYKYKDDKGVYRLLPLLNPNDNRPNLTYEFLGIKRVWRWTKQRMEKAFQDGIVIQLKPGAVPQYKKYLEDSLGKVITNDWSDIKPVSGKESLGYPTQKPEALMERIIEASSNKGDLVADFFCGCGTTIAAANKLNRKWIGVDISHLAIKLILKRLTDPIAEKAKKKFLKTIDINGFPKDIASAKQLAKSDELKKQKSFHGAFDFQHWVVEFLLGGIRNPKEIADGGWDGYITFPKNNKEKGRVLLEVKSGKVNVKNMREFIRVIDKEEADIGIFVCFEDEVTKPMTLAAKEAGKYKPYQFDRIQILTIEDIFDEREIKMPGGVDASTFKQSTKDIRPENADPELF